MCLYVYAPTARVAASEFRWTAPAECGPREQLELQVQRLSGKPIAAFEADAIEVEIRSEQPGQFRLQLRTWRAAERDPALRELQAHDCAELIEAAAVAIVVAANGGDDRPPPPRAAPSEPAEAPPPIEPPPEPSPTSQAQFGFAIGAAALLDHGALPAAAWGVEGQIAASYGWLRLIVFGGLLAPQRHSVSSANEVEFGLAFARAMACAQWPLGRAGLAACAGFEFGRLHSELVKTITPMAYSTAWRAFAAQVTFAYTLVSPLTVTVSVGLTAPLTRDEFWVNTVELAHRPASVGFRASIGPTFAW